MPWPAAMADRHQSLMVSIVPASPPTSLFSPLQYPPVSLLLLLRISIFLLLFFLLFPFSVDSSSTTTSSNFTSTTSSPSISTMTNINKTTHPVTVHHDDVNAQPSTSSFDDNNIYNMKHTNGNGADADADDFLKKECLTAPTSVFLSSVKSTIEEVRKATFLVSKFANTFHHDFRFTNAINDCLELLDLSAEELNWTLSSATHLQISTSSTTASNYKNATRNRPSRSSDLRSWLSAALANQDTCIDGFESTHSGGFIKDLVAGGLEKITFLVSNVLGMVRHPPPVAAQSISSSSIGSSGDSIGRHSEKAAGHDQMRRWRRNLPSWMTPRDRRLLMLQIPIDRKSGVVSTAVDAVVAADGSGNFTRIMDAVLAAPDYSMDRYLIYIKRGKYMENVEIKKKKWNLMMIGDGIDSTIISSNRNFIDGWTTFRSATFAVTGKGFIARDLTFENTAGPEKHQAVALRSDSDLSAYYRCGIKGYQDTLYAHSLRQFYRECRISGTVDFIFGNGAVVFQNCQILARKPLSGQKNSITAQGRKDPNQNTGFTIQFSNISADSDLAAAVAAASNTSLSSTNITTQTYLGRPWKQYSRTVFLQCYMGSVIRPEGWLEWQGDFALDTLYYGEYMNYGPGAGLGSRVKWSGFHPINESTHAVNFTVARFIDGNSWLPSTGVKFTAGLVI